MNYKAAVKKIRSFRKRTNREYSDRARLLGAQGVMQRKEWSMLLRAHDERN